MIPILLSITLLYWITILLQNSLLPFWAGDWVFIFLFLWTVYFSFFSLKRRWPTWFFLWPIFFAFFLANFLFYSYWLFLPYLISALAFFWILKKKSWWLSRYKEGFLTYFIIFSIYCFLVLILRIWIFNYFLTFNFLIRFGITFFIGLFFWLFFVISGQKNKIR